MTTRRADPGHPALSPHATAPRAVELPTVNHLVRLVGPGGAADPAGLPSRIEDIAAPAPGQPVAFLVAAPAYPGDLLEPEVSDGWLLTWVSERGRWELPVRRSATVDRAAADGPRCWWLTPSGQLRRNQRRSFYRVGCATTLSVDVLADPFPTLVGRSLDVSEGGVRCLLPATGLTPGTRVLTRLGLDDVPGTFPGVVRRSLRPARAARVAGWHREVAIAFDDPEVNGDGLRRTLARMQVRAQRLAPPRGPW